MREVGQPKTIPDQQSHDDLLKAARSSFARKDYRHSIKCLAKLRTNKNYTLRVNTNISSCLLLMGLVRPARRFIERALSEKPDHSPALLNLAEACLEDRDFSSAERIYRALLSADSGSENAYLGLARAQSGMDQNEEAFSAIEDLLAHYPSSYDGHLLKGQLYTNQNEFLKAIGSFAKALSIAPEKEDGYAHLSVVMIKQKDYENALRYLEKALEINPDSSLNNCRKAQVLQLVGRWQEAGEIYEKLSQLNPASAALFLNANLLLPAIPSSRQDIENARVRFEAGLAASENNEKLRLNLAGDLLPHTFALAYHGHNDRLLLERYNDLLRRLSTPLISYATKVSDVPGPSKPFEARSKIRIGFISKFFSGHSNALAFEGLIRHLDRSKFEVILIHLDGSDKDAMHKSLDEACDKSIQLNSVYTEICSALRALHLDILFFTDIGMNGLDCLIPFLRSAPIQITGWGIPHTSGIKEIDYYISSEDLEALGKDSDYTETLVKLPVGLPCCFLNESLTLTPLPREYFLLPPGDTLFGCLQSLHKLHPDYDALLEEIALANPDAGFVFVEDPIASRTKMFLNRLEENAPSVRERCITLALMNRQEYHAISHCLDVLLDPIYYGSGITFFEASFVGAPIVTLEGNNLRSRVVACGYREMGLENAPIAKNSKEYVELATRIAQDSDGRQKLRSEILEKNHLIFNRMDYVRSFEKFCIQAVSSLNDCRRDTDSSH